MPLKPKLPVQEMLQQAVTLHQQRQLAQAEALYKRILQIDRRHFDAVHMLGVIAMQQKNLHEALALIGQAIAINPDQESAHANIGHAYNLLQRHEEALASFDRALKLKPEYAEAHKNRGNALFALQRHEEAVAAYDRALALKTDYAEAYYNRGSVLAKLNRHEEALASFDRMLTLQPRHAEAYNNRGNVLCDLGRYGEALASYDRALSLKPDHAQAYNNRGIALFGLAKYEDAIENYERALALKPGYADAHSNQGDALSRLNRHEEALASYGRALALEPGHAEAHSGEGLCRLRQGDLGTGWEKYEWRWKISTASPRRNFPQPLWLGDAPLAGKTILLHAEQGLGDTIQFIRYAGMVAAQGAKVLLEVQPALKALLASVPAIAQILAKGEPLPAFDYHCPLLSLPLAFRTRLHNIPAQDSYLHSDPECMEKWRARLGPQTLPRIGLAWSGNASHKNDHNRSIPLAELVALFSDRAQFFSVQKDVRIEDRRILDHHSGLRHLGDELDDFADTAAAIALMDIVITVDTSIAHLAGALGKPVWILLPFSPDWRWLLDRTDSPWYPTARLFRQTVRGDWGGVIEQMRAALRTA